ncbi:MAG: ATP synthase subunit C [Treponema sp.]|nr:ATP synthase subunit C [Treponema sp.]
MKKKLFFLAMLLALGFVVFGQEAAAHAAEAEAQAQAQATPVWKYFAAALAVGISCIAGGIAVGQIGSAAMGAMSENPELSGKALPYAGLAEGICLWGFIVALIILLV